MINKAKVINNKKITEKANTKVVKQEPKEKINNKINFEIKVPEPKKIQNISVNLNNHKNSIMLNEFIINKNKHYNELLENVYNLNSILSESISKKKINIRDIEIKLKNEALRKENEALQNKKDLEDKVFSVLEKANSCLENIKNLSKKKEISIKNSKEIKQEKSNVKSVLFKEPGNSMETLINNLKDKYITELNVNTDNMNSYFGTIAKNRKSIKDLKDKYKRVMLLKGKAIKQKFSQITVAKTDNISEYKSLVLFKNLDLNIQASSLIHSDLFEKLFLKTLYINKTKKDFCENDIYDVFSFWYYLKNIKNILSKREEINLENLENYLVCIDNFKEKKHNENQMNNYILRNIQKFFEILFNKNKNKISKQNNNKDDEINEANIFDKNFYKLYEMMSQFHKINLIKFILSSLGKLKFEPNKPKNLLTSEKEDLLYLKSIYSIIKNNGSFSYQICNK